MQSEEGNAQVVPEAVAMRLFAPAGEIEPVDVPGVPDARVFIRRMDWYTKREWQASGQTIRIQDGRVQQGEASVELHTADQDLKLLLDCLSDWTLPIIKAAQNSPGETVTEEMRPPRDKKGLVADASRRAAIKALCTGTGPLRWDDDFVDWLVGECKRVNGLGDSGNSSASS